MRVEWNAPIEMLNCCFVDLSWDIVFFYDGLLFCNFGLWFQPFMICKNNA